MLPLDLSFQIWQSLCMGIDVTDRQTMVLAMRENSLQRYEMMMFPYILQVERDSLELFDNTGVQRSLMVQRYSAFSL